MFCGIMTLLGSLGTQVSFVGVKAVARIPRGCLCKVYIYVFVFHFL